MTPACQRTVSLLGQPTPPEVAEHVRSCAECQAVVQAYEALGRVPRQAVPPALEKTRAAALEALSEQTSPRAWWVPTGVLLLLELGAAAAGMVWLGASGIRLAVLPVGIGLTLLAAMVVGAVGAMGRSAARTERAALPYAGLVVLLLLGVGALIPASPTPQNCLGTEVLLSLVPMGAAVYLLAGTAFRPWTTLLATLSAGVAGLVALSLHCSNWDWRHVAAFHLAPWMALACLAVWIRSRIPSRTFAP
jgi:hypothetical protein